MSNENQPAAKKAATKKTAAKKAATKKTLEGETETGGKKNISWGLYKRKGLSEMRPYVEGEDLSGVSISDPDEENGSPKAGDMIARNPRNHDDQWLVSKKYFEDNLEPAKTETAQVAAHSENDAPKDLFDPMLGDKSPKVKEWRQENWRPEQFAAKYPQG